MATTTQTQVLSLHQKPSRASSTASSLPPYEAGSYQLRALSATSSHSSSSSPPKYYDDAPHHHHVDVYSLSSSPQPPYFHCTKAFQVEAQGRPLIALPTPPRPIPIRIYNVDVASGTVADLAYESIRPLRCSGNSILIRAGDVNNNNINNNNLVCRTTYRWGPGRPPKIELVTGHGEEGEEEEEEEIQVVNKGLATRAQVFRTQHLGTFEWRYAGRGERKKAAAAGGGGGGGADDSLLVLDRIVMVASEGGLGQQEERRVPVARFVRNEEVRTRGTKATTAGNGGRLMVDLREWEGVKGEMERVEVLVVASCLVMLKKEVDRRRMQQAIATVSLIG
ncbi:hypothetical protein BBK36DRAFT_1116360 [Trichoderma citrinoviride]|uniref:Uncharacterized protein n=1 Tax=Trichoderma citrinoviride TaxID=58853 RepID=A0A2T4BDE4_9HYPO|nr:hypothetical protein BBK36DRAFT_1116360 [Trichoderma citrinoviride]PTB67360.1 hypothetical protein BBK36DRAFT_1116360 [Trichoderma citrinoviride]